MREAPTRLLSPGFSALLGVAYLGFAQYHILQAVLPVLIISQGGNATVAGIVVAAHSLPSILFRPSLGWLIDRVGPGLILGIAGALLALSGFAYFLPGIALLIFARLLHGTAWSAFSAAGHATLVRLAPQKRRVEAAGFYNLMAGVAQSTMPAAAFVLISAYGFLGGLALSAVCGVAALVLVVLLVRHGLAGERQRARAEQAPAPGRPLRQRIGEVLIEPAVLRPLAVEVMYSSVQPLFLAFAPVYALTLGVPISFLPIYFLAYGSTLVGARLILGARADRHDRLLLVRSGVSISLAALGVLVLWPSFAGLVVGGALFAIATTLVSPTTMALTMDLAPPGRVGSAMATYTLGFPLATGGSAAIWGVVIQHAGFPAPFLLGALLHLVLLALLLVAGSRVLRVSDRSPIGHGSE